jgi:hypothetical protein
MNHDDECEREAEMAWESGWIPVEINGKGRTHEMGWEESRDGKAWLYPGFMCSTL